MGAFIGTGNIGIWASNGERNDFLDWFADNRCSRGDTRWQWCKSEAQRWPGCGIQFSELLQDDEAFRISEAELLLAEQKYGPQMPELLKLMRKISRGEWPYTVSSSEAILWRPFTPHSPSVSSL